MKRLKDEKEKVARLKKEAEDKEKMRIYDEKVKAEKELQDKKDQEERDKKNAEYISYRNNLEFDKTIDE